MSSEKRKFKYKLSGFEQMWNELERLEAREVIMMDFLKRMLDAYREESEWRPTPDQVMQAMLEEMNNQPGKSRGYKMIEQMGLEFYEVLKEKLND